MNDPITIAIPTPVSIEGVPTGYVGPVFEMDPATDDLIRGEKLKNGMIVLIHGKAAIFEDPENFKDPENREPYGYRRLRTEGRWCMVTELHHRGPLTSFIGLYSDGTKYGRTYNEVWEWYVKKSSI